MGPQPRVSPEEFRSIPVEGRAALVTYMLVFERGLPADKLATAGFMGDVMDIIYDLGTDITDKQVQAEATRGIIGELQSEQERRAADQQ